MPGSRAAVGRVEVGDDVVGLVHARAGVRVDEVGNCDLPPISIACRAVTVPPCGHGVDHGLEVELGERVADLATEGTALELVELEALRRALAPDGRACTPAPRRLTVVNIDVATSSMRGNSIAGLLTRVRRAAAISSIR